VIFAYASSAYIALWVFLHIPNRDDSMSMTLLFAAALDWAKQAFFVAKKMNQSPCCLSKNKVFGMN